MPRLTTEELCLANLREEIPAGQLGYLTKTEAHAELVKMTGKDFGIDAAVWEKWLRNHPLTRTPQASSPLEAVKLSRHRTNRS